MASLVITFPPENTAVSARTLVTQLLQNRQLSFDLVLADGTEIQTTAVLIPIAGAPLPDIISDVERELPPGTQVTTGEGTEHGTEYTAPVTDIKWAVNASSAPTLTNEASPLVVPLTAVGGAAERASSSAASTSSRRRRSVAAEPASAA